MTEASESVRLAKKNSNSVKHPNRVGMSCKNTRFIKRGLTWEEVQRVEKSTQADKLRWEHLFSLNKWKPTTKTKPSKVSPRTS